MDVVPPEGKGSTRGDFETALTSEDRVDLRVWLRLITCVNLVEHKVRNNLREEFETTLPRFDLLAQLDRAPKGLSMGQLSRRLMVSNGNVTGLINRLLGEGLVERCHIHGDRRTQLVSLTPAGKTAFDAMIPAHARWINEAFASLSRQEMATLYDLLAKLKAGQVTPEDRP